MKYCKDCVGFDECKTTGRTVEFAVDDGVCIDFDERKPQTNADRIRAMSDEELAKVLNAFTAYFEECNRSIAEIDCHDCELYELCSLYEGKAIDWLKQPADKGE